MSFSGIASSSDKKLSVSKPTLNPNAAEFVPSFFKMPVTSVTSPGASSKFANTSPATPGKTILERSESSVSNNSDEEAQQYWRHQLPDDIIPDFNTMGIDDTQGVNNNLPFSSLSSNDISDGSRYSASIGSSFTGGSYSERPKYPISSSYGEYPSPTGFQPSMAKPWDQHARRNDQLLASEHLYNGDSEHGFMADMPNEHLMENTDVSPIEFLASQFPGFAADSLAEVYFANEGDLNLTIEMLAQLELQVEGGFSQALNSKPLSAPNLGAMDFPALSPTNNQNGLAKFSGSDIHQNTSPFRGPEKDNMLLFRSSSSIPSSGATDFASAVRKMAASQESSIWKYEGNGSSNASIGSSRNPQVLASSYSSGQGRGTYGSRLQNQVSARASPTWLETGEAVGNMYSEMREDARDHARVRNAYFEQARQAYLIGNKALAKELSIKGQLHNMQMKAAHAKAQESIYRQRNSDMHVNGRERMIDLHGLHVTEAIHVLKRELAVIKNTARATDQRLLVYICVGTGHHTRGSRTPARLPTAVQRYLLEEEGLDYSEPQAGLLRVVIY